MDAVCVVRCAFRATIGDLYEPKIVAVFSNKEKARLFSNTIRGSWVEENVPYNPEFDPEHREIE